MKEKSIKATPA